MPPKDDFISWRWGLGIAVVLVVALIGSWATNLQAAVAQAQERITVIREEHAVLKDTLRRVDVQLEQIQARQKEILEAVHQ